MKTAHPLRRLVLTGVLAGAVALSTGCGNRLPDEEFAAADTAANSVTTGLGGGELTTPDTSGAVPSVDGSVPGTVQTPQGGGAAPAATPAGGGTSTKPDKSGGGATGPGSTNTKPGGAANGAGVTASAACTKQLSPIVIGQTGAFSGVIGAQLGGIREGLAVWVQAVNAAGGVQCHPIKVFAVDDGSDPGRAAANWNDLVKNKGAIAILGTSEPLTAAAYRSSAERDRIPIIGGDGSAPDFWTSPYMFSQGGEALASYNIGQRYAAQKTAGAKKIGLAYCVEASICTAQKNNFPQATKDMGLEVGPVQAVSLTQPDYTSECQAMKSADVKAVWIMVDGSAISRFLRSCASLGYNPTGITGVAAIGNPKAGDDANMRKNGMYMGGQVAPFVANDTPGAKAFQAAVTRYAAGVTIGQATMMGWTSGKLFEAALAKVADRARAGDVNTALVLDGLWSLKDEKLDGLSPGVTFIKGKPAPPTRCAFIVAIGPNGWTAPEGSKAQCL